MTTEVIESIRNINSSQVLDYSAVISYYGDMENNTMPTWIEDDSSVIDAIESAKSAWFEAHAECSAETTETTDAEINEALGLPRGGAIRPLADEFADWGVEEVMAAVTRGLDNWWNRAEVRYETLTDYQSAPSADKFAIPDIATLESISADINEHESTSTATEWSRSSWECDREACTSALALARAGQKVFVAQDEDGYYFATERA